MRRQTPARDTPLSARPARVRWRHASIAAALFAAGPAFAQFSQLDPKTLRAAQPLAQTTPAADPYLQYATPRTITLQAGTGMLLRLPVAAGTVMSAEPGIARVQPASPTSLFLMGVSRGRTTVIATSETGAPIGQFDVIVTTAGQGEPKPIEPSRPSLGPRSARETQQTVHRLVPGARSISAEAVGGRLVLRGAVPNAFSAQQVEAIARGIVGEDAVIIDNMTVLGSVQVNVRVRIAEINRIITRQLGFNWQSLGSGGTWQFGLLTGAGAVANGTIAAIPFLGGSFSGAAARFLDPRFPLGLSPFQNAPTSPYQIGAGFNRGKWDINGVIDALAADQLITILAEPNLTAQSGETASFLAGGEFPIPIAGQTSNGSTTISVEFKQFGVSLALVPTVLSPGRLNLRIRPEVSELSNNGAISIPIGSGTLTLPALSVRRAETTVELGSGQSFAIAGLLQRTSSDVTSALPGIGEVPVIGALFKSNNFQRGETELVIIVTPYLVKPVDDPEEMHAPTDGFRPANDADRILLGRQIAPRPARPPLNAGFILK